MVYNLESRAFHLGNKTLISPVEDRAKSLVVLDAVGDHWGYRKAAHSSLGLWCLGVGPRMCLQGLGSRQSPLQFGQEISFQCQL